MDSANLEEKLYNLYYAYTSSTDLKKKTEIFQNVVKIAKSDSVTENAKKLSCGFIVEFSVDYFIKHQMKGGGGIADANGAANDVTAASNTDKTAADDDDSSATASNSLSPSGVLSHLLDLCEDNASGVRKASLNALIQLCRSFPQFVEKVADIFMQILSAPSESSSAEDVFEIKLVNQGLTILLELDLRAALRGMFHQIEADTSSNSTASSASSGAAVSNSPNRLQAISCISQKLGQAIQKLEHFSGGGGGSTNQSSVVSTSGSAVSLDKSIIDLVWESTNRLLLAFNWSHAEFVMWTRVLACVSLNLLSRQKLMKCITDRFESSKITELTTSEEIDAKTLINLIRIVTKITSKNVQPITFASDLFEKIFLSHIGQWKQRCSTSKTDSASFTDLMSALIELCAKLYELESSEWRTFVASHATDMFARLEKFLIEQEFSTLEEINANAASNNESESGTLLEQLESKLDLSAVHKLILMIHHLGRAIKLESNKQQLCQTEFPSAMFSAKLQKLCLCLVAVEQSNNNNKKEANSRRELIECSRNLLRKPACFKVPSTASPAGPPQSNFTTSASPAGSIKTSNQETTRGFGGPMKGIRGGGGSSGRRSDPGAYYDNDLPANHRQRGSAGGFGAANNSSPFFSNRNNRQQQQQQNYFQARGNFRYQPYRGGNSRNDGGRGRRF